MSLDERPFRSKPSLCPTGPSLRGPEAPGDRPRRFLAVACRAGPSCHSGPASRPRPPRTDGMVGPRPATSGPYTRNEPRWQVCREGSVRPGIGSRPSGFRTRRIDRTSVRGIRAAGREGTGRVGRYGRATGIRGNRPRGLPPATKKAPRSLMGRANAVTVTWLLPLSTRQLPADAAVLLCRPRSSAPTTAPS